MSKELEITDEQRVDTRLAIVRELVRRPDFGLGTYGGSRAHVRWSREIAECATILSNMVLGVEDPPPQESEE